MDRHSAQCVLSFFDDRSMLKRWLFAFGCVICLVGVMYLTRMWIRTEFIPRYAHKLSAVSLDAAVRVTITDISRAGTTLEQPKKVEVLCSALWAHKLHTTTDCSAVVGPRSAPPNSSFDTHQLEQSGWSVVQDLMTPGDVVAAKQFGSIRCDVYYIARWDGVSAAPTRRISAHCYRYVRLF